MSGRTPIWEGDCLKVTLENSLFEYYTVPGAYISLATVKMSLKLTLSCKARFCGW